MEAALKLIEEILEKEKELSAETKESFDLYTVKQAKEILKMQIDYPELKGLIKRANTNIELPFARKINAKAVVLLKEMKPACCDDNLQPGLYYEISTPTGAFAFCTDKLYSQVSKLLNAEILNASKNEFVATSDLCNGTIYFKRKIGMQGFRELAEGIEQRINSKLPELNKEQRRKELLEELKRLKS